jgi:hypothetical protein
VVRRGEEPEMAVGLVRAVAGVVESHAAGVLDSGKGTGEGFWQSGSGQGWLLSLRVVMNDNVLYQS